jgi:hypothetical protein
VHPITGAGGGNSQTSPKRSRTTERADVEKCGSGPHERRTQAGPKGPANSIVSPPTDRSLKGRCGTSLRSVSSLSLWLPLDQPGDQTEGGGAKLKPVLIPGGHVEGTKSRRQNRTTVKIASELAFSSGRDRRRSGDLTLFRRALYQLSYPTGQPNSIVRGLSHLVADLTGFEPATSALTGRRALQTAPQVRNGMSRAARRVGVASLLSSPSL